jgi:hypothetical protein
MNKAMTAAMAKATLTLLVLASLVSMSLAKAGDPIPLPKQSVAEAVVLARTAFDASSTLGKDKQWRQRFIVISVVYSSPSRLWRAEHKNQPVLEQAGEHDDEWSWFVTFIHPTANDVSYTYRVYRSGIAGIFRQTE